MSETVTDDPAINVWRGVLRESPEAHRCARCPRMIESGELAWWRVVSDTGNLTVRCVGCGRKPGYVKASDVAVPDFLR